MHRRIREWISGWNWYEYRYTWPIPAMSDRKQDLLCEHDTDQVDRETLGGRDLRDRDGELDRDCGIDRGERERERDRVADVPTPNGTNLNKTGIKHIHLPPLPLQAVTDLDLLITSVARLHLNYCLTLQLEWVVGCLHLGWEIWDCLRNSQVKDPADREPICQPKGTLSVSFHSLVQAPKAVAVFQTILLILLHPPNLLFLHLLDLHPLSPSLIILISLRFLWNTNMKEQTGLLCSTIRLWRWMSIWSIH